MVHFIISLVIIELSLDLYLSVARVSMEITEHTNINSSFLERNKEDVAEFHEPFSKPRRSDTKSDDDSDGPIADESNTRDAPTTDVSPIDSHARYASANETSPRRSKRLSLQNILDTRDAHKYVNTDTERSSKKSGITARHP